MSLPPPDPSLLPLPLPGGIRSRFVDNHNGLVMHLVEAGFEQPGRPCIVLLHGFPELAYSWRKLMLPLAQAGYHVIAPDQRGYGRTTGWDARFYVDVAASAMPNLVLDVLGLLHALGRRTVAAVFGHDFGSTVAAWCALTRPDVFRSVAMMSSPFGGPPALPFDTADQPPAAPAIDIHHALAALGRPRKHYKWYYATPEANADMWHCEQGVHDFLRAYFHMKSADWPANQPQRLQSWTAGELARMPTYYIMDLDQDMAQTVRPHLPDPDLVGPGHWLGNAELQVYTCEFSRTGFQGGLQWYRCSTDPRIDAALRLYAGRSIDVPAVFIAGASDWGVWQTPGAFERMQSSACTQMRGVHLVPGAGHWVQQEQAPATVSLLLEFLASQPAPPVVHPA